MLPFYWLPGGSVGAPRITMSHLSPPGCSIGAPLSRRRVVALVLPARRPISARPQIGTSGIHVRRLSLRPRFSQVKALGLPGSGCPFVNRPLLVPREVVSSLVPCIGFRSEEARHCDRLDHLEWGSHFRQARLTSLGLQALATSILQWTRHYMATPSEPFVLDSPLPSRVYST